MAKRKAARTRTRAGTSGAPSAGARKGARKTNARKTAGRTSSGRTSAARKTAARKTAGRKTAGRKTAARKTTARKTAGRKAAARTATARTATARKAAARTATTRKATSRKATTRKATARKAAAGTTTRRTSGRSRVTSGRARGANVTVRRRPELDDLVPTPPSSLDLDRSASAARSGRRGLRHRFDEHTETGPAVTGGDIDADWESAYSVGDEAPGGDNPTPDQDIVDDIGRALGVQYEDNEELKADEKIARRDRHRWELDPASSEDYEER